MAVLTQKQQLFTDYYLSHTPFDAVAAYVAVYGDKGDRVKNQKNASQIFNMPACKQYRERRRKEILDEMNVNAQAIAMKLMTMAMAPKDDQYYTPTIQTKALDLLQKQLGIQQQKTKIDAEVNAVVQFVEDIPNDADTTQ